MADHPRLEAEWLHPIAHILIATKRCLGLFAQLTQLNVACELVGRLPVGFDQRISEQTSHFLKSDIGRKRRRQLSVPGPFSQIRLLTCGASELQRSGHIHTLASNCHRQGHGGLRGFAMSEPIKSQSISRRRLFWLAAIAAAVAAPATMLSTSDARAQQSDQAPAAEPTAPKTGEKKKKKKTKATPGATTAPASSPPKTAPAPPKQQ